MDIFIVCLDDFFRDGEAEAGSFFVFAAGRVGFIKTFPDFLQAVLWDAFSGILYGNESLFMLFGGFDVDGGLRMA